MASPMPDANGSNINELTEWASDFTFEWPSDHQVELQTDLTENWPFAFGGGLFDIFGQVGLNDNVQVEEGSSHMRDG
jgi:hypothetical protein